MTDHSKSAIQESQMDGALCALLTECAVFQDRFLDAIGASNFRASGSGQLVRCDRNVWEAAPDASTAAGETDLLCEWQNSDGKLLRVRIEHKLATKFQPRQIERYRERITVDNAEGSHVRSMLILIAPRRYLEAHQAAVAKFDCAYSVTNVLEWIPNESLSESLVIHQAILAEIAVRDREGLPYGSKGLFVDLYAALRAELTTQRSALRITNDPTDWVYFSDSACVTGMHYQYRIRKSIAEVRIGPAYAGDRARLRACITPPFDVVVSGGTLYIQLPVVPTSQACRVGQPTPEDVTAIVSAVTRAAEWWRSFAGGA